MVSSLPTSKHIYQPFNHFKDFFEKVKRCCTALPLYREVPGTVTFVSKCAGDRISDKEITETCGLLQHLLPGKSYTGIYV